MARVSRKTAPERAASAAFPHVYKAALYVRLSDEDIRKKASDSIGTQKALLMDFLQRRHDMGLGGIYEDVSYTGTNFNRPGFARMMGDIQGGLVDCVIVKDLSRLGRNFGEMGHYLERVFPFLGVRFISVGDNFDSLTAALDESSLVVPLKNLMNEAYVRDISKKVRSSLAQKRKRGEFCGPIAPYGYVKDGTSFAVDEEAAAVVRQVFGWVLEGMGDRGIARKLNALKISPPSRHRFERGMSKAKKHGDTLFWQKTTVKGISENPVYTGAMVSGKFQSGFLHGGGRIVKSSEEWVVVDGTHPAIISKETFEAVQKIRQAHKRKASGGPTAAANIFRGLIRCGDCKKHMARNNGTYRCSVYGELDKCACTPKTIKEADLRAAVFACISREIRLAVDMEGIVAKLRKQAGHQGRGHSFGKQISALQSKLEQNRRFRGSLREDYRDGILSEQDYMAMKADYDGEKDSLERGLKALAAEKAHQDKALSHENEWMAALGRFEGEQQLSAEMVSALVERIDVYDGARVEVTLKYRDGLQALLGHMAGRETGAVAANE